MLKTKDLIFYSSLVVIPLMFAISNDISPIRIHKVHRTVVAEDVRRGAVVLLRQRARGCPAWEEVVV